VGALAVVVKDKLTEHPVEMAFAADKHPVEALGPRGADEAFGEGVRSWRPNRGLDDPGTGRPRHLVERPDELDFRACWVTQAPAGWAVTPARNTFLRSRSMKNST
jgi:hypothetical protein